MKYENYPRTFIYFTILALILMAIVGFIVMFREEPVVDPVVPNVATVVEPVPIPDNRPWKE